MPRRLALLGALLLPPGAALAEELYASDDGELLLEGSAFYKPKLMVLRMPAAFVELSELTAPVTGAAPIPAEVGLAASSARVWGKLVYADWLELATAYQMELGVSNVPDLSAGALGMTSVSRADAQAAQRRWVDFDEQLLGSGSMRLVHNLDEVALRLMTPWFDLVVGRQVLSWGTGRLWNPTDLLSPFSPASFDREVRRGADAARVSVPIGDLTMIDLIWLPVDRPEDHGGVVRFRSNLWEWDLSLSAAKYVDDLVAGVDFVGDIGEVAAHGEAAYTRQLYDVDAAEGQDVELEQFLRAVAGVDWMPDDEVMLGLEYHYNGHGTTDEDEYLEKLQSPRIARGEVFGIGQHYVAVTTAWMTNELVTLSGVVIANVVDPSFMVMPFLEYWMEQSVILRVGGYISLGKAPEVVDGSSLPSLKLRSEYGANPHGLFLQVGTYF